MFYCLAFVASLYVDIYHIILLKAIAAIMANVKMSDVVDRFSGKKDEEVSEWLKKTELVASLQKTFLKGPASAAFDQLDDTAKDDYQEIKAALLRAFLLTTYKAFEGFSKRLKISCNPMKQPNLIWSTSGDSCLLWVRVMKKFWHASLFVGMGNRPMWHPR